ncbi:hypothetical protein HID58_029735 [Brassica napus]|uniref:Uncharacterized protein n=1 Tax=Brassica napus TaxID=3708 RepID=A0ABQ8CDY7_BRANA|nr:hypothetical protein HID58_029735 [Brassica napus]
MLVSRVGVAEGDLGVELLGGHVVRAVDIRETLQELHAGLAELLRDEDRGFGSVSGGAGYEDEAAARGVKAARWEGDGGWERGSGGEGKGLEGVGGGDGDRGGCGGG